MSAAVASQAWAWFMFANALLLLGAIAWSDVTGRRFGPGFFALVGSLVGNLSLVLLLGAIFGTVPDALASLVPSLF